MTATRPQTGITPAENGTNRNVWAGGLDAECYDLLQLFDLINYFLHEPKLAA